jgi:hypothetical protein
MTTAGDLPDWQRRVSTAQDVLIFNQAVPANTTLAGSIPCSQFTTLTVSCGSPAAPYHGGVSIIWLDTNGDIIATDTLGIANTLSHAVNSFAVPVRAAAFTLNNGVNKAVTIRVDGSTVPVHTMLGKGYTDIATFAWPNQLFAVGANVGPTTVGADTQGEVWIDFSFANNVLTGELSYGTIDSAGVFAFVNVIDSTQMHTMGGRQHFAGKAILPATPGGWQWTTRTADTTDLLLHVVSLGH